jgi:hypothetical protein
MIKHITLWILLITAGAFAEEKPLEPVQDRVEKPLLRDGFVLMGVDGKLIASQDKWFFVLDAGVSDGRTAVEAGTKIEIMPSAGLEKMVSDSADNPGRSYRLYNAMVTLYHDKNYLFCDYFLPLTEADTAVNQPPAGPNEPAPEVRINEPNDVVVIPQEIVDRLKTRRIIRPEKMQKGFELKQDSILTERTGFIEQKPDGGWFFRFDALGRNTSNVSLELLPCQALEAAQYKKAMAVSRARFKVSGVVTKYHDRYYMLLQTANRAYGYGNFGS